MTIVTKSQFFRLRNLVEVLETQPVVKLKTDDSPQDALLLEDLRDEVGYSCLKMFSENEHVHWIINEDFPNIEFDH